MSHMKHLLMATAATVFAAGLVGEAGAVCKNCGTVTSVQTIKKEGEASGAGAVIGGIAGGVLGHQIGSGRGKDVATIAGAAGGAYAGHQVEKSRNTKNEYVVNVRLEDGTHRTFRYSEPADFRKGDKVKIIDSKLVRD